MKDAHVRAINFHAEPDWQCPICLNSTLFQQAFKVKVIPGIILGESLPKIYHALPVIMCVKCGATLFEVPVPVVPRLMPIFGEKASIED